MIVKVTVLTVCIVSLAVTMVFTEFLPMKTFPNRSPVEVSRCLLCKSLGLFAGWL